MLAKSLCVAISSFSYYQCAIPPKSAKSVSNKVNHVINEGDVEKIDHVINEGHFAKIVLAHAKLIPSTTIFLSGLYILLMMNGRISTELELWQVVLTIISFFGYRLRTWSFKELGTFFTFSLMVRPGHRLVKTGPYKYLRHPSYTGMHMAGISWHMLVLHTGLLNAITGSHLPWTATFFVVATYFFSFLFHRVRAEETMLTAHFGSEWTEYALRRAKFIPFIL